MLTLSTIRAGGVGADAASTYLRAVLLEAPQAGQEALTLADEAAQTSGAEATEGSASWAEECLVLRMQKGAPRPPLLQLRLWDASAGHDGAEAQPLASAEVRLPEGLVGDMAEVVLAGGHVMREVEVEVEIEVEIEGEGEGGEGGGEGGGGEGRRGPPELSRPWTWH